MDVQDSLDRCAMLRRFNGLTSFYGSGRRLTGTLEASAGSSFQGRDA
jgi:hypothetical protein